MDVFLDFISNNFFMIWYFALGWAILSFSYLAYKRSKKPDLFSGTDSQVVIYKERFASASILDSKPKGNASNCLTIVVTQTEFWVTSFFPFNLILDKLGLELRIKRSNISSIEMEKRFFGKSFLITFVNTNGKTNRIRLFSKNFAKFAEAIGASAVNS